MEDAEELMDRILYLGGHPHVQRMGSVRIGEDPKEMVEIALEGEQDAIEALRAGVELRRGG